MQMVGPKEIQKYDLYWTPQKPLALSGLGTDEGRQFLCLLLLFVLFNLLYHAELFG